LPHCPPKANRYAGENGRADGAMIIGRFLGLIFVVCGLAAFARDFWVSYQVRSWSPIALGQLWYDINRTSLIMAQAGIERYLSVRAWDIIDQMLTVWACVALLLIGVGLLIAFRRRQDVIE
jgi:hypothetical protein